MSKKLPFGLKAPSKGTVIFFSVLSVISGTAYGSIQYANQARKAHCDKVSFLADRPCGVHEMPRKVAVYLMPPPGDSIEKSRAWFREYVKPILVAGAVDYEVMEGKGAGAVESSVCEEIKRLRREQAAADPSYINDPAQEERLKSNPFAPLMQDVQKKIHEQNHYDGVIAIGRLAWGEVLSGIAKGCHADPNEKPKEEPKAEAAATEPAIEAPVETGTETEQKLEDQPQEFLQDSPQPQPQQPSVTLDGQPKEEDVVMADMADPSMEAEIDHFSIPQHLSPVVYIPHENIIGWTNIPYRLYRWATDYTRVDEIGQYAVDVVLKHTRPLEIEDVDVGEQEKKYWLGDDAQEALANDQPITLEDRVRSALLTYTNRDSP
ncbi:mitochondrial import inner membrane translocase subunit Tim54 [Fennellomyces sp. T-0311]|nr:mitochondrial import inner membrane translocase subunit Tim54 [Fennellomyces sp. T-0311]